MALLAICNRSLGGGQRRAFVLGLQYVSLYAIHQVKFFVVQRYPFGDGILEPEFTGSVFKPKVLSQFDCRFFGANDCLLLLVIINTLTQWSHGPWLTSLGAAPVQIMTAALNCHVLQGNGREMLRKHLLMLL